MICLSKIQDWNVLQGRRSLGRKQHSGVVYMLSPLKEEDSKAHSFQFMEYQNLSVIYFRLGCLGQVVWLTHSVSNFAGSSMSCGRVTQGLQER